MKPWGFVAVFVRRRTARRTQAKGGCAVLNVLIYAMIYLGSALMVYNIYGFIRFVQRAQHNRDWGRGRAVLYIPVALLVMFLLGYLAVGIFGKPDLIISGILFGGSVFVFFMFNLLQGITDRIQAYGQTEAKLMAAEASSKAKTEFLSSVSHEMRTPMNAIIGLDEIALKDGHIDDQTRERLEKIGVSARHMMDLINNVLDMNDIESGQIALRREPFSMRELLALIGLLVGTQCREKGLTYRQEAADDLEDEYVGDGLRLKQVLLGILDNAVKFTPAPGTVTFRAEQIVTGEKTRELRFTVSDTGIGMDAAFLPRLFDSFAQEDASSTNRYGGSGLSMALAKRIMDLMGGAIEVQSQKGRGSTFTVTVPLGRVEAKAPEADEPDFSCLHGRRVLIAEDIDLNAEILADLLELEEIDSERARNGQEALDLFSKNPPGYYDAILMELRMPVMYGLDATRAIRALDRPDARQIPIAALTANALEEDVQHSLEAGMNVHLSKPADSELLYTTLAKLIAKPE